MPYLAGFITPQDYGAAGNGVADDTTAVQDAINAVAGTGGTVYFPPGTYLVNSASLSVTGPCTLTGAGSGYATGGSTTPAATITCTANNNLFTFPYQGYLWGGLEVSNLAIAYSGTGNVFHALNFQDSSFRDVSVSLTAAGSMAFYATGNVSVINCLFDRVWVTTTAASRTSPMVSLSAVSSGEIADNTFRQCKFTNAGLDNTQFMVYVACTGTGVGYHYATAFRDCYFEHPFGGAVTSLSGMNLVLDNCMLWDVYSGQGQTVGNSLIYVGAYSGNSGSQGARVTGCGRNRNGPNGTSVWDVYAEATTSGLFIEGFTVKADGSSTSTPAYVNLNTCIDATLIANQAPQGSGVNGNSSVVVSNPPPTLVTLGGGAGLSPLANTWLPSDHGYLAWSYDPALSGGQLQPSTGAIWLTRVNIRSAVSVTNVIVWVDTAGSGLTAAECFAGLYNSTGTRVAVTADQSAVWTSGGFKTTALAGGPYTLAPGFYWVAVLANGTTMPQFGRMNSFNATITNAGTGAAGARAATNGTGTTLPASITPGSNSLQQTIIWAALS